MSLPTLKEIVKENPTRFSFYRQGYAYYTVPVNGVTYQYPIDLKDLGGATITDEMKAITLMRYIRKAIENETFVKAV